MTNNQIALCMFLIPTGILLMAFATLWQMFVMFSETHTLNRFKERELVKVVAWLFFSFSFAVYYFCPNARKKGLIFLITGIGGALMYGYAHYLIKTAG